MKKLLYLLPLLLAPLLFAACADDEEPYVQFDKAAYSTAKATWEARAAKNYTFTYQENSDAVGPGYAKVTVTVTDGNSEWRVSYPDGWQAPKTLTCDYPTADALFAKIWALYENACATVEQKPKGLTCKEVSARYDATGIPTKIDCAGWWSAGNGADGDWWGLVITDIAVSD